MRVIYKKRRSFLEGLSVNTIIIFLNFVFWLALIIGLAFEGGVSSLDQSFLKYLAINPSLFLQGYFWTPITSMFSHISFTHLLVNMVSMFFIGSFIEKIIGRKRYVVFYLISGVIAGLAFVGLSYLGNAFSLSDSVFGGVNSFAVGASGALFGLGGLLAVLIPRLRVLVFFILPMPMWLAMIVLMFGLWAVSIAAGLPVGNTAHFGGLVVGLVYGFYLRNKYSRKVNLLNRMFR